MATYWVSTTGNDANDGLSKTTAWATLTHAIANSADGDTIMLADGIYDWTLNANTTAPTGPWQFNAKRIFQAETIGGVIFDGQDQPIYTEVGGAAVSPTISGIVFQNAAPVSNLQGMLAVLSDIRQGAQAIFDRCQFKRLRAAPNACPFTKTYTGSFLLRACLIEDWLTTAGNTNDISKNAFYLFGGQCSIRLHNCTLVFKTPHPDQLKYIFYFHFDNKPLLEIVNCIFYSSAGQMDLLNRPDRGVDEWRLRSSCLFGVVKNGTPVATIIDEANILENTDPQFVDAAAGDYNLLPTSPCIDAGEVI